MKLVAINQIKANPKNPRVIKDFKYQKLKRSIIEFPEMLAKRPLVCFTDHDGKYVVLGGNMRLRVSQEIGLDELPIILADEWSEDQKMEFLIKDNVNFGEWNFDDLANNWDDKKLKYWGMDIPVFMEDPDYSILDEENLDEELSQMSNEVKKGIVIEFQSEHYEQAFELIKYWRGKKMYIGGYIMEKLKEEKERNENH